MEHTDIELRCWVAIIDRYTVYKNGAEIESLMESSPDYVLKGQEAIMYNKYMEERDRVIGTPKEAINDD